MLDRFSMNLKETMNKKILGDGIHGKLAKATEGLNMHQRRVTVIYEKNISEQIANEQKKKKAREQ